MQHRKDFLLLCSQTVEKALFSCATFRKDTMAAFRFGCLKCFVCYKGFNGSVVLNHFNYIFSAAKSAIFSGKLK